MPFLQQEDSGGADDPHTEGVADHDQPYRFGWRPRASAPYPFSTRQYARLLVLRSRLQDQLGEDRQADPTRCPGAAA